VSATAIQLDIGSKVRLMDMRYKHVPLTVVGVLGNRIHVERTDQYGKTWQRYEDNKDLVLDACDLQPDVVQRNPQCR